MTLILAVSISLFFLFALLTLARPAKQANSVVAVALSNDKPVDVSIKLLALAKPKAYYYYGKNRTKRRGAIDREKVRKRHDGRCAYCSISLYWKKAKRANSSQVDHKVPFIYGGEDEDWNLMPLCPKCNTFKGDALTFYTREIVHALGLEIEEKNGRILPFDQAKRAFIAHVKEYGRDPDPAPFWLIDKDGKRIFLEDFHYNGLFGLDAEAAFLDDIEKWGGMRHDWRQKMEKVRTNICKEIHEEFA